MSRELAIRVPQNLADWVRRQPGSASETVLQLAGNVYKQQQYITVPDPGAGTGRVKLRLPPRALQFIRKATKSRDTTAAVRKLLTWGVQGAMLPSAPVRGPLPGSMAPKPRPVPSIPLSVPVARKPSYTSLARVYEQNPELARLSTVRAEITSGPVVGASIDPWEVPTPLSVTDGVPQLPAFVEWIVTAIPLPVLCLGLPIAFIVALHYVSRWIDGLASSGTASTRGVAESGPPDIAAWKPQAAKGLGALL